jgi:hypothetical protein
VRNVLAGKQPCVPGLILGESSDNALYRERGMELLDRFGTQLGRVAQAVQADIPTYPVATALLRADAVVFQP